MDARAREVATASEGQAAAPVEGALIGRDEELERLVTALRGDTWIAVVGEAGIGKTSLIRAALATVARRTHEGGAFATLQWMPYLALRRAIGRPIAGDPASAAAIVEAAVGPDVLVLDDLQWADSATLAALELLAGHVQVVAAIRHGDPGADAAQATMTAGGASVISLAGLPDASGAALLRRLRGDLGREATTAMLGQAGGNPLLLEEMARSGEAVGVLGRTLEARRARLSAEARRSLDLLAVAERPLPSSRLAAVDELRRSGLVRERAGDPAPELEVRHALLADAIRAGIGPDERRELHLHLAELVTDPAERARHLLAADRADDAAALVRATLPGVVDPRSRSVLLVALAEATGRLEDRVEAARELVALFDFEAIVRVTDVPADFATKLGLEAAYQRANALLRVGRAEEGWDLANAALAGHPDKSWPPVPRLAMLVAMTYINLRTDPGSACAYLDEFLRDAPASRDVQSVRYTREIAGLYNGQAPDLDLMTAAVTESFADSRADVSGRAKNLSSILRVMRSARASLDLALEVSQWLEANGYESPARDLHAEAAESAVFAGEFELALSVTDDILDRPSSVRARLYAGTTRALAYGFLGRFDLARASLESTRALHLDTTEGSEVLIARLEVEYWAGEAARASATAGELFTVGSSSDLNLVLPLVTAAWIDLERGREIRVVPTYDLPAVVGLGPEMDGIRALATGRPDEAIEPFERAAELLAPFVRVHALHCAWAAAEARRRSGAPAVDALRAVEAEADAARFVPLVAKIRRSLRLAGVRVGAPRDGPRRIGLSARETEVVHLVEEGLSNLEIARRLGLGRPTVSRMVSSAMGKLGVARRTELVARELV